MRSARATTALVCSLLVTLSSITVSSPAIAQAPAAAATTCIPSWGRPDDIAKFQPDHPYMIRGYAAELPVVIKALEGALAASGYTVSSSRRGSIETKPASAVELKGDAAPKTGAMSMGMPQKYYKVEQMTAFARTLDGKSYVFLTYQTGTSKSNSRFDGTGAMADLPTPLIACDAAPYKDILDQIGKAVTPAAP